nr:PREDICTED: tachykinin-3 isoform X2 [Anolis carolinensis]|eukprot:XP_008102266.1 PREDICTED: tachykinin-3 isoform X2 [Anolis carolinensis]
MKSPFVLTVLLSLLVAKLCHGYCVESQEQQLPSRIDVKKSSDPYRLPPSLLRRLYDGQGISYEALLRLSGKEEIGMFPHLTTLLVLKHFHNRQKGPQTLASSQKRDMHDFFVGLMGKRTTELDQPTEDKGKLTDFGNIKYSKTAE